MNDNGRPKTIPNSYGSTIKSQSIPMPLNPIVQPIYANQMPVSYSPIYPVQSVPQPTQYVTPLEPVYIDHLSRHESQHIVVITTAGKFEGVLTGVAVDHIQLNITEEKAVHIRIAQIVSFEGFPISYR